MAGKLYKYNDSWVSYGYLHDTFGYTDAPSFDISYKSTNPWGEVDTTGYMSATDFYDIRTYELWKQGLVGWYSMNEMAVQGSYPDTATETMMRNGNVTSNAAYITDQNGVDYYIIEAAISEGWLTLDEWALLGWEPRSAVESPLCGSMGADYSESVMFHVPERMERGGIGFTGLLRENVIPSSGVVEVDSDGSFSIDLGLKTDVNYNWQTIYFGDNDWWYSGILNQEDKDTLESLNLRNAGTSSTGPFGIVAWNDAYTYEVTDLFTDVVDGHGSGSVPFDASNFHCEPYNVTAYQSLIIRSILAFSTGVKAWRCKITPPSQFDVWIESVDLANNVVVALRSVFTGLTATRANTIVNNAPTYLSRYNSYLNNHGGPYTMEDAISMRDNLQSKIPSGDTSTFGIRPAT